MTNKLKHCPFCGGKVEIKNICWGHRFYNISCKKCKVSMSNIRKKDLFELWNRRADNDR